VKVGGLISSLALITFFAAGCDDTPTSPSTGAVVTFEVANEVFRVLLTDPEQIRIAKEVLNGAPQRIPNGRIVQGTQFNTGWSWHTEDVVLAETAIELCDGRPSDVERQGTAFGGGRFCPWSARLLSIDED
jgi:hypothetical protein